MSFKYIAGDYYARLNELKVNTTAHIDALTPGHQKADCGIIGPGIIESHENLVHIPQQALLRKNVNCKTRNLI